MQADVGFSSPSGFTSVRPGRTTVTITRSETGTVGIVVIEIPASAGHTRTSAPRHVIQRVVPGGAADSSQKVASGDLLLRVDGIALNTKNLQQVKDLLLGDPYSRVILEIEEGARGADVPVCTPSELAAAHNSNGASPNDHALPLLQPCPARLPRSPLNVQRAHCMNT